jgi:hypothetical protein
MANRPPDHRFLIVRRNEDRRSRRRGHRTVSGKRAKAAEDLDCEIAGDEDERSEDRRDEQRKADQLPFRLSNRR